MAEIAVTRMSSRGQVVIPAEVREGFGQNENIIVIRSGKQIILERSTDFQQNITDDIKAAKRVSKAWKKYDAGKFVKKDKDEFLKELETW
ncbi:MAG: AbrB/MazE/SpoVT family DNA-binding domain-containing protein [archaeon]